MPSIEGVSCWVSTQANGKLIEYSEEEDSDARLHAQSHGRAELCYIQSEEDAEFTVSVQTDPTFFAQGPDTTHLSVRFRLDGVNYMPHRNLIRVGFCRTIEGYRIEGQSNCYVRMRFGKLNIAEEKPPAPTEGDFPNEQLGEITVLLYRYKRYYDRVTTMRQAKDKATRPQIESDRTVHEKALKGRDVTHFVGGGRVVEIPPASSPVTFHAGDHVDPVAGEPYMQFTFRYRSESISAMSSTLFGC